jgi:hypothetical protein
MRRSRVWTLQCTDVCWAIVDVAWPAYRHVSIGSTGEERKGPRIVPIDSIRVIVD